jgi:hypothetical protein
MDFRPIGFDCEYALGYFCLQPGAGERQDTPPSPDYFLTRVNFNAENPMEDEGNKVGESVPLKKIIELKWNGNFLMRGDGFFRVGIDRAHFADFILDVQNCYSHSHLHI